MKRSWMSLTFAAALAGCGTQQQPANENIADVAQRHENKTAPAPVEPPDSIKPGEPGGLPDDRTLLEEGPIDPKSGQGAGQVLQRFGGLLEQRRFAEARRLWSDDGRASGLTEREFIEAYDKYAEVHSEVGAPGRMEGAAGSSYVEIPFRLYGTLKTGKPFNLVGPVTLRRVNDVPGSTEEQRRWHIYRSGLKPRP
ncbi:MAG: hypothetical protein ACREB1_06285 [Sphingomicrobium sp.]